MSKCVCFTNDTHTLNENAAAIHPVYQKPDLILLLPLWMLPKSHAIETLLSSKATLVAPSSYPSQNNWLATPLNNTDFTPHIATTVYFDRQRNRNLTRTTE